MLSKRKEIRLPKSGEKRQRAVFAWKPVEVSEGTIWLERFVVEEEFFQPASGNPGWWAERGRHRMELWP